MGDDRDRLDYIQELAGTYYEWTRDEEHPGPTLEDATFLLGYIYAIAHGEGEFDPDEKVEWYEGKFDR